MARDFGVEGEPVPRERSQGVLGGRGGRVDAAGPVGGGLPSTAGFVLREPLCYDAPPQATE